MNLGKDFEWQSRLALLVFLVAVAARLAFIGLRPNLGDAPRMDSARYRAIAHNIVAGRGFSENGTQPTSRVGPVYPGFIAGIYLVFGENGIAVRIIQAVLGALVAVLIFWTTLAFFSRKVALIASLIVAVHPELVALPAFLYSETVFTLLLAIGVLVIMVAASKKKSTMFLCAGIVLGLATLCRAILLPVPVFLFLAFLVMRVGWRPALGWSAVIALGMAICIVPWAARNYAVVHEVVPVSEGTGVQLWEGNYLPFDGRFRYVETDRMAAKIAGGLSGPAADRKLLHAAIQGMRDQPWPTGWLMVRKVGRLWLEVYENVPIGAKRTPNRRLTAALASWHYALLALAAAGAAAARGSARRLSIVYMLLIFMTMAFAVTFAVPRYRLPVMPYVCMLAAVGVCGLLDGAMRRSAIEPVPKEPKSQRKRRPKSAPAGRS